MTYQPGQRVFIKESMSIDAGVSPALIGTVEDDLGDYVTVKLDRVVTDVPGVGDVVQWTDPDLEVQDFIHEFVVSILPIVKP